MPQRIGDDVRRGLRPQPPRALRVAAAWGHLPRCASSPMRWGIASSARSQLAPRRSQRGLRQYSDGLLGIFRRLESQNNPLGGQDTNK